MNAGHRNADPGRELMGAYLLGLVDAEEARTVETRLAADADYRREMEELREMTDLLGEVPPEALLDGPPEGDLVLARTLRQVRVEAAAQRRRRFVGLVAVAAAALAVVLGGGVVMGRAMSPTEVVVAAPPAPATGGRTLQGRDGDVSMAVTVTPAAGWVRVTANVAGVPEGEHCYLVVVARDGTRKIAAGWVVSQAGERGGTTVNGSASVPADQVAAIVVENEAGRKFVTLQA